MRNNRYKRWGGGEGGFLSLHTNTTRCDIRSNHDRALAALEFVQNPVTFVLLLVAMNCCARLVQSNLVYTDSIKTYKVPANHLDAGIE